MDNLLPIDQAASRFNLSLSVLRQKIESGTIRAAQFEGSILVSEMDVVSDLPKEQRPEYLAVIHLRGVGIGLREAARKYNVTPDTISEWVKHGYIAKIGMAGVKKVQLDEADCAYCASVYHQNPGQGKRIFNPDGTPYRRKTQ